MSIVLRMRLRAVVLRRSVLLPVLVTLAVVALIGHASAPLPAAGSIAAERSHTPLPVDPHGAGGSHIASCEATAPTPAPTFSPSPGLPCAVLTEIEAAPRSGSARQEVVPSRRAPDRPLFVLHASFLI